MATAIYLSSMSIPAWRVRHRRAWLVFAIALLLALLAVPAVLAGTTDSSQAVVHRRIDGEVSEAVDTLGLLDSRDKQVHLVRRFATGQERLDFGHADLFLARDADKLAWNRIHRWLAARDQHR